VAILGSQPIDPYPIYMAIAHYVGYDRRGNTIYRRHKDGTDIIEEVPIVNPTDGRIVRTSKERVVANDLPSIVRDYIVFRENLQKGRVHFDKTKGLYCVLE